MSHSTGMPGWSERMMLEDVYDVPAATRKLEVQAPLYEPGSAPAYHTLSMGRLLQEAIRRVTGKGLIEFVREELVEKLGVDSRFGVEEKVRRDTCVDIDIADCGYRRTTIEPQILFPFRHQAPPKHRYRTQHPSAHKSAETPFSNP